MINQLQTYVNTNSYNHAHQLITSQQFYNNLTNADYQKIVNILQNNYNTNKNISTPIIISLYSIIIMKYANYNQKSAIEILTKLYKNNMYKEIIVGLLVKIPIFSNYRLIVKDLIPKYVDAETMKAIGLQLKKQVPQLFENKWKDFKVEWFQCSQMFFQRDLGDQVCQVKNSIIQFSKQQQLTIFQIKVKMENIRRQYQYLTLRIQNMKKQQLNIQLLTASLNDILYTKYEISPTSIFNKQLIIKSLTQCQDMALMLLNILIKSLGKKLIRKIKWIHNIIIEGFMDSQLKRNLCQYAQLLKTYINTFGQGSFDNKQILFDSQYSIVKLLQTILHGQFEQKRKQTINFQKPKKQQKKQKLQNLLLLNVNTHHFQTYLKDKSNFYRNQLVYCVLEIFLYYYKGCQEYYKASYILNLVENCKNPLDIKTKRVIGHLKSLFFKDHQELRPNFEYFCEEVFNNYINTKTKLLQELPKQKKTNNFSMHQVSNIMIDTTQFVDFPQKKSNSQEESKIIKRTASFQMQGWQRQSKQNVHLEQVIPTNLRSKQGVSDHSELFYSIKQCSAKQEADSEKNRKESISNSQNQQGFILTPQF